MLTQTAASRFPIRTLPPKTRVRTRLAQRALVAAHLVHTTHTTKSHVAGLFAVSVRSIGRAQLILLDPELVDSVCAGRYTLQEAVRVVEADTQPTAASYEPSLTAVLVDALEAVRVGYDVREERS